MFYSIISSREKEILDRISEGYTSEEIAGHLLLSPHTVITHRRHLLEKLEVKNTASLVRRAFEPGLLSV